MAIPLEKFVTLLEESGILAGDTIKDFIPPKASPKDAAELARELVRKKKLTKFQAEEVSKGKGKSLVLGNYVLMEKIGAGGMGQVFKAEHRRMHRTVAIKMLPPNVTKDAAAIARFEREVTAAAKLRHPNIVAADDADCANGIHFLVMELIEGQDLSALVRNNGPCSVEKAVNYILQAARGLEAAHKKGIIHRDIKPANLLLDKEGVVKILDMGLARLSLDGDEAPQADLTSTGTIMGTVDYMAPEQALDTKAADARADIYALGCSLYFLLTGKSTYEGDTLMKKLLAHREQPIPALRTIRHEVTVQIEAVFKKLVAKKVEDRYQSMTEVIVELERCTAGSTTSVTTQQPATTTFEDGTFDFLKKLPKEPTILAKPTAKAAAKKMGSNKTIALIGAAVLGVVTLAGIIVSLRTKDGTLIVEGDQPDAMVQVLDAEGKVEISQKGGKGLVSISVDPGKHRLQVEKDGFTVFGQDFEVKSGGKTPIKATLVPLEEQPEMANANAAVAEVEKPQFFQTRGFEAWAKDVAAMPAEIQLEAVHKKLVEMNPGFHARFGNVKATDGTGTPIIENGVVVDLSLSADNVTDISPVRAFVGLKSLAIIAGASGKCRLSNLSSLQGTPLEVLLLANLRLLSDISTLKGLPLKRLYLVNTQVSDLSPLKGMKLTNLDCDKSPLSDLSPLSGMSLFYFGCHDTLVSDLTPLKEMPITSLYCQNTQVFDLSPLKGMKLQVLNCSQSQVSDLSPLKEMPLKEVSCDFDPERDTELLRSIKTLEKINGKAAAEFWKEVEDQQKGKKLGFQMPGFDQWVKDVQAMPAEKQVEAVRVKLMELNPGFDGTLIGNEWKGEPEIRNGVVTLVGLYLNDVTDISPVRALSGLTTLGLTNKPPGKGKLSDLSPLRGMHIKTLFCTDTPVADLSPLRELPQLTDLFCQGTAIVDLSPLSTLKLTRLDCSRTLVNDLSPLVGMPLTGLFFEATGVVDLSPLEGMNLVDLQITPKNITKSIEIVRSMQSLKSIGTSYTEKFTPAEFWARYDAGDFGTPALSARSLTDLNSPDFKKWVKDVQAMPAEKQIDAISVKLMEMNPGFDGKVTAGDGRGSPKIENGVVTEFGFVTDNVSDISPVRALSGLKVLMCNGSRNGSGRLSDLSPLEGMKLENLVCFFTQVSDLSPIRQVPLKGLVIFYSPVSDLAPLQGMPLEHLDCSGLLMTSLMPLTECKNLRRLIVKQTKVTDSEIAALRKAVPNCQVDWDDPANPKGK